MTSATMLARARMFLDEASASFWSDAEIYYGLSDGQREVANLALAIFRAKSKITDVPVPEVLRELIKNTSGTIASPGVGYLALPADYWQFLSGRYKHDSGATEKILRYQEHNHYLQYYEDNEWITYDTKTEYLVWTDATNFNFSRASTGSGTYDINYFQKPTEIASGTEPILSDFTHEAIVYYAVADMLMKDQRLQEAQVYFQKFLQLTQNLIGI